MAVALVLCCLCCVVPCISSHHRAGPATTPVTTTAVATTAGTTTGPGPTPTPVATPGQPPPVPASGSYLGAWVNPTGTPGVQQELAALPGFESTVGRPLRLISMYTGFATPPPVEAIRAIVGRGAIPLIAWSCVSVSAIAAGTYDRTISTFAAALREVGAPVFLRWFWEMNLHDSMSDRCLGGAGPGSFVAAWRHIWTIFRQAGASNVAFVWCPGAGPQVPAAGPYFPGPQFVDWIGADGYDRHRLGSAAFADIFGAWYSQFGAYAKPMMVAETGAPAGDQAAYLQGIAQVLPSAFPAVKALAYFDASGPAGSWVLGPSGEQAFAALARQAYFSFGAS